MCDDVASTSISPYPVAQLELQRGPVLDAVVRQPVAVLHRARGSGGVGVEGEALLPRVDAHLVHDLGLEVVDGVGGTHVYRDVAVHVEIESKF